MVEFLWKWERAPRKRAQRVDDHDPWPLRLAHRSCIHGHPICSLPYPWFRPRVPLQPRRMAHPPTPWNLSKQLEAMGPSRVLAGERPYRWCPGLQARAHDRYRIQQWNSHCRINYQRAKRRPILHWQEHGWRFCPALIALGQRICDEFDRGRWADRQQADGAGGCAACDLYGGCSHLHRTFSCYRPQHRCLQAILPEAQEGILPWSARLHLMKWLLIVQNSFQLLPCIDNHISWLRSLEFEYQINIRFFFYYYYSFCGDSVFNLFWVASTFVCEANLD